MTTDKSVNFSTDTIVNESIKKVKDTIKQDNKEILGRIERVAVAFEKFGQNRSSRSRNRSGDRDSRRSSNDRYSRSSSRSPDRGSYDRRSYSPYRDNSGDRYNDRYDRRIDIVQRDQGHLEIIILEDIEVEVIQDLDIKVIDNHLRNVLSVVEQDIQLKSVGTFKNIWRK